MKSNIFPLFLLQNSEPPIPSSNNIGPKPKENLKAGIFVAVICFFILLVVALVSLISPNNLVRSLVVEVPHLFAVTLFSIPVSVGLSTIAGKKILNTRFPSLILIVMPLIGLVSCALIGTGLIYLVVYIISLL